ncbi:uncharacterized protein EV422DRAFT_624022 [Fimicolochytrium jonesii]|uniref:uncharacterized protein n=1 Tax=Fimicolochytrium jonesii TaxID=1396493 RepID=UPI0022FEAE3A|nr:uncharacterized protein EV422DRAFT_624022 [Fimicolochytrium jonesii]KAI8815725.1 hypothetical protein EV422DRAFT_624022 [Fimicolochytrium jonesii]
MSQYPPNMKAGDWMCTQCNCHNFQSRAVCFRCQAPKEGGGAMGPSSGGYGGMPHGPPGGPIMRPGDWICEKPGCGFQNFASRQECFRCKEYRPQPGPPGTHSGNGGYGSGNGGYGGGSGGYGSGNGGGYGSAPPMKPGAEHRPGDWDCESCHFHNFQSRSECYKCGHGRNGAGGGGGGGYNGAGGMARPYSSLKPGDWLCPSCQAHNFRSRVECFRCRAQMPAGGGDAHAQPPAPPGAYPYAQSGQSLFSQGPEFGVGSTYPPGVDYSNGEWRA